ncbi:MAG TPA: AAA family ATPase [Vicinamibacterales bacterium]|nr:AAA family ATPase [Vicinamibacterales bacterium]
MFSPALEVILNIAFREAISRGHAYLTLEHLLYALAHDPDGERILGACGVDLPELRRDLDQYLDESIERQKRGTAKDPEQTVAFRRVLQTAILHVQSAQREEANAGDILAAMLQQPKSYAAQLLGEHGVTRLDILNYISHGISKTPHVPSGSDGSETQHAQGEEGGAPTPKDPLAAYCQNLTERASQGLLDPLIGRVDELQRTIEVLCRRRKNNPVFVGDPGVGKTALAEGLASRLLHDDVQGALAGAEVFSLDTGALLAGTRFRGDFEERFKAVVTALAARPKPILFIDEMHSTVGAGAVTGGTMDLATMLKPLLTAGSLRVIGSTTHEEFKHIEKDRALARRLQKIAVEEPSIQETIGILSGLRSRYEDHHGVRYTDAALEAAAKLAARHLRDYKLPDSAIDLMDEAGSVTRLQALAAAAAAKKDSGTADGAVDGVVSGAADSAVVGSGFSRTSDTPGDPTAVGSGISRTSDTPGIERPVVDARDIERVAARVARIPDRQATASDRDRLQGLEESLTRVVFGQNEAVHLVAQAIKRSRAGLGQPERPAGCFLFTGPTGVGKTELAKQLALLLGNEFIRFDMSEYMEKHAVARLIGAPPGYVGFEQGGLLVDAVRQHPYSVVLLDEIEKAHPDIYNVLLQVMDHATLTDNAGRKADFRNTVVILTSNAGSREMGEAAIGFADRMAGQDDESRGRVAAGKAKTALERVFSPEFRNRLDAIVMFKALSPDAMETIVDKFILQLESQLTDRKVAITLTPAARAWLATAGYDRVFGARPLARVIQREVRDVLTDQILFGALEHGGTVTIDAADGHLVFAYESQRSPAPVVPATS